VRQKVKTSSSTQARRGGILGVCALALMSTLIGGCSFDSYMDPSVVGRWERTPTRVPILNYIGAIEDPQEQYVEVSDITSGDLIPETDIYRVGPGDFLDLTIYDLITRGQAELLPRQIDQNGYIQIPQLGRIFVSNKTETEVADAIAQKMAPLVADPLVSVVVQQRRQQVFHLTGNVGAPGPYTILNADFRLFEALIAAGGFPEFTKEIFVIRQVPLDENTTNIFPENPDDRNLSPDSNEPVENGENLLDIIDDLSAPGMISGARTNSGIVAQIRQPSDQDPIIDLIEPSDRGTDTGEPAAQSDTTDSYSPPSARWRFVDGQWVRETIPIAARRTIESGESNMLQDSRGQLFTQRVIRVPVEPLVAGDARYNIVIRPGDIIRVPPSENGFYYLRGEVNRPGVYNLPGIGKLTLLRAIASGADFSPAAIPERIDLTRIVGPDEQATIMLNARAIAEGTQPDIYIKADDMINVGTSFWATPLAVLRGGFRTNYGFGFLLDRNFGNDVFGSPPTNRFGQ
jgi:polysaccharide export outer membrane protein